jgi:hypothetical protein
LENMDERMNMSKGMQCLEEDEQVDVRWKVHP